jgi:hypothetical protein
LVLFVPPAPPLYLTMSSPPMQSFPSVSIDK